MQIPAPAFLPVEGMSVKPTLSVLFSASSPSARHREGTPWGDDAIVRQLYDISKRKKEKKESCDCAFQQASSNLRPRWTRCVVLSSLFDCRCNVVLSLAVDDARVPDDDSRRCTSLRRRFWRCVPWATSLRRVALVSSLFLVGISFVDCIFFCLFFPASTQETLFLFLIFTSNVWKEKREESCSLLILFIFYYLFLLLYLNI